MRNNNSSCGCRRNDWANSTIAAAMQQALMQVMRLASEMASGPAINNVMPISAPGTAADSRLRLWLPLISCKNGYLL